MNELLKQIENNFVKFGMRNAFCIEEQFYTYQFFQSRIYCIREIIQSVANDQKIIGIMAHNHIDTYASIFALWMEGRAYVPLHPQTPVDRNEQVISQSGIKTLLSSETENSFSINKVNTTFLAHTEINHPFSFTNENEIAYLLFTSGSTGVPKGVPITRKNLDGFVNAFLQCGYSINEEDKVLQSFDLTFDLSVMSYLIPILFGACAYTVSPRSIKYNYIFGLLEDHQITMALMVPSVLNFLRPYFNEINLPQLKYSLFCGEALHEDVCKEWSDCVPNAIIENVYGPTEDTIFCTTYTFQRDGNNKSNNGILSIGKAMAGTQTIIVDAENKPVPANESGELCLSGIQLTPGYWNNPQKNSEAFFEYNLNGMSTRFYRTGDLCFVDKDGDIMYSGRIDFQTKIQGYRVELSEIEFHVKSFLQKINAVAVAFQNENQNTEIGVVLECNEISTDKLIKHLKMKLPSYMIPSRILFVKLFPLNANGKTDRKQLTKLFESK